MNKILICAELSKKAYKGKDYQISKSLTYESWFESDNKCCFIAKLDKELYVVFRGSNDLEDWIDNLKFSHTTAVSGRKYHFGHYQHFQALKKFVFGEISNQFKNENDFKINFCGHSLGGSLATIAASEFISENPELKGVIACYTFGSNRNMNRKAKKYFDNNISESVRCVNSDDIVPKLPLKWKNNLGYFHVSGKIQLGIKPKWYEPKLRPLTKTKRSIDDHHINSYIDSIKKHFKFN